MWYKIVELANWFGDLKERYRVVRTFNDAAKMAFIGGDASTLLQAKITRGDSSYKHAYSKFMAGGFRIKALSGAPLPKSDLTAIARVVLDNEALVRQLLSLGWDTLEVHDNKGAFGVKFALKKYANLGGYLN